MRKSTKAGKKKGHRKVTLSIGTKSKENLIADRYNPFNSLS